MKAEKGVALIVVLLMMALFGAIGAGLVIISSSETLIAANFRTSRELIHAAGAGMSLALAELRSAGDWTLVLGGATASVFADGPPTGTRVLPGGGEVSLDALVNLANCDRAAPCSPASLNLVTPARPWAENNPRWRLLCYGPLASLVGSVAQGAPYYVVTMVGDDGAENDGDPAVDGREVAGLPNPGKDIVRLRAEAIGPRGARYAEEAVVKRIVRTDLPGSPVTLRVLTRNRLAGS